MTIDYDVRFNTASNTASNNNQRPDRDDFDPSQFWIDIGFLDKIEIDEATETRFVSTTKGIGLEELDGLTTEISNELCRIIQEARVELLSQIVDAARSLNPGDSRIVGNAGTRQIMLGRANADAKPLTLKPAPIG